MASFVEQATLKVNDQSTAQINRINASLKKLFATARSLKSVKVDIHVNDRGLAKAAANARQLTAALRMLKAAGSNVNLRVNTTGIAKAQQQLRQLQSQAQRPINVVTRHSAAGGARAAGGAAGGGWRGQGPVGAGLRGAVSGSGVGGVAGMYGAFGAVAVAGYAAAAALRSVADNAAKSDRSRLQAAVAATEEQRKVFAAAGDRPAGAGPIALTKNERDQLRTSLLGDVQGQGATAEERATNRAKASVEVAKQLETTVLPRLFAQSPGKSREETLEGLRKLIQGVNLASTDIVDSSGKFSKDGLRVLSGIQKAMAADPDISPALVKSTLANLKTAGYTLDEDNLARVLINAGSRGVRAANEAFQAMRSTGGSVDIKGLNDSLEKLGLISGGKRKGPKGDKGLVPGSSKVKDPELWAQDPATWFQKNYVPGMEAKIKAAGVQPGTKEWDVARKNQIEKDFAGAKASAVQGITDMVLGFDQMNATLQQANDAMKQNVPEAVAKSWIAQAESVKTAWADAAGGLGQAIADKIDLAKILESVAAKMREDPKTAVALAGLATAAGAAIGVSVGTALLAPSTALTGSASALTGAAAALNGAAAALGGKGMVPPGGTPGAPGTPGGAPGGKPTTPPAPKPGGGRMGMGARVGIAGLVGIALEEAIRRYMTATPEDKAEGAKQRDRVVAELKNMSRELTGQTEETDKQAKAKADMQKAVADRGLMRQAVEDLKREQASIAKRLEMARTPEQRAGLYAEQAGVDTQITALQGSINGLTAQIAAMTMQKDVGATPQWVAGAIAEIKKAQLPPDWKPTPEPIGGKPETQWPDPTAISNASAVMKAAMDTGGVQIQGAANTLLSTTGTFQSVFATGAQAIGSSGQIAASTLQGAAPGIGASIGQAAASAIQAAVSNLNVNVNVNQSGGGGDKGNINNANGNK